MPKQSKALKAAIEGVQPIIKCLREVDARRFEQVTDQAGIIMERWVLPNGKSVIVYGTPDWRDMFIPGSGPLWSHTENDIRTLAAWKPTPR